jgi:hypothetical protein
MNKLSREDKRKLWTDTKSYHVAAVLDKATSARLLQPLPTEFELQGKDGEPLRLITPARPACLGAPARSSPRVRTPG